MINNAAASIARGTAADVDRKLPTGALALATMIQSFALPRVEPTRRKATRRPSICVTPAGPALAGEAGEARIMRCRQGGAHALSGAAGDDHLAGAAVDHAQLDPDRPPAPIARRKLSTVTSKCTNARLRPSGCGISVALATTHSFVSGETYGRVW